MTDQPVSLASLMTSSKTVEFDFADYEGMKVSLTYLPREQLIKLRSKCVTTKFDRKTHQPSESLDEEKFLKVYVKEIIRGWTGLKYKYLEELLLVDVSGQDPEEELPFSLENAELLMRNSDFFDTWVTKTQADLANFTSNK